MTERYRLRDLGDGLASTHIATDAQPHVTADDVAALRRLVATIADHPEVRALVVRGGERTFCGGATRDTLLADDAADAIHALVGDAARLLLSIEVPTVAAMRGHAVGGGLMFGLWCDAAVLARESLYSANFVQLGFTPGMGSTALLPELVGPAFARELLLTGCTLKGSELGARAPQLRVVPRETVLDEALDLAAALALPSPPAVRLTKRHLAAARRRTLDAALRAERELHREVFADDETRRTIDAQYIEDRR